MLAIAVKGPIKDAAKAAQQIASLYQTAGKVVRVYKNVAMPVPMPVCDVVIVVEEEKPNGK